MDETIGQDTPAVKCTLMDFHEQDTYFLKFDPPIMETEKITIYYKFAGRTNCFLWELYGCLRGAYKVLEESIKGTEIMEGRLLETGLGSHSNY